jgi:glycosyltransferase involved in cell wall biosynthesis
MLVVTTVPLTVRYLVLPVIRHFRAKGWRVDAMAAGITESSKCGDCGDRVWDVSWSRNPLDPRNLLRAPQTLRRVVSREQYDIVHVHTPVAAFVTRFALRNLRRQCATKVIYTAHGLHFHPHGGKARNAVFRRLEQLAGRWTDYLVVVNRVDAESAMKYRLVPADRLCRMPGIGVNLDYYNPDLVSNEDVERFRKELHLRPETLLFVKVAEFITRKRHRDVLLAFRNLDRPEAHLAFAGDGPIRPKMEALARRLGLQDRVHFLGFRRDIPLLMRSAVATVLAAQQEGLPQVVMESMCLGTPVIGSRIRGTEELLEDDRGLLYELGDVQGLAARMAWVLDHPAGAREMSRLARDRMESYDVGPVLQLHEDLYERALQL